MFCCAVACCTICVQHPHAQRCADRKSRDTRFVGRRSRAQAQANLYRLFGVSTLRARFRGGRRRAAVGYLILCRIRPCCGAHCAAALADGFALGLAPVGRVAMCAATRARAATQRPGFELKLSAYQARWREPPCFFRFPHCARTGAVGARWRSGFDDASDEYLWPAAGRLHPRQGGAAL